MKFTTPQPSLEAVSWCRSSCFGMDSGADVMPTIRHEMAMRANVLTESLNILVVDEGDLQRSCCEADMALLWTLEGPS